MDYNRQYEGSLTTNVQKHIENKLAAMIADADDPSKLCGSVKEVRSYLTDSTTLSTFSFVLRRYIQAQHPELLPKDVEIPDLVKGTNIDRADESTGFNVNWPADVVNHVAKNLEELSKSKEVQTNIKEATWKKYLSGGGLRNGSRDVVHRIIMTLNMDVESAVDIFVALGYDVPSAKYPLDLVSIFAQTRPGTISWPDVEYILEEFEAKRPVHNVEEGAQLNDTLGMTAKMVEDVKALFEDALPEADLREAMVDYMVAHSNEFPVFINKGSAVHLPGYSQKRLNNFYRLALYLRRLYPLYAVVEEREIKKIEDLVDPEKELGRKEEWKDVKLDINGIPDLPSLAKAMLSVRAMDDTLWAAAKSEGISDELSESMRKVFSNFSQHMSAVNRLRTGGSNVEFVTRRDVLLMLFFFIRGCVEFWQGGGKIEKFRYLTSKGEPIDQALEDLLCICADIAEDYDDNEDAVALKLLDLQVGMNNILAQFDYMQLYLPSAFDRFILLSLLGSDELADEIMSVGELEYEESLVE